MGRGNSNWRRLKAEDDVLAGAADLDPDDHSDRAEQIRETAADIQDRRDQARRKAGGN